MPSRLRVAYWMARDAFDARRLFGLRTPQVMWRKALAELWPSEGNLRRRHACILDYLREHITVPPDDQLPEPGPAEQFRAWTLWWQGKDDMPPIISADINSKRRHLPGIELVVIDKHNVGDYIDIPDFIRRKFDQGIISVTLLSDYVRLALLARHGGFWLDATALLLTDVDIDKARQPYYTLRQPTGGTNVSQRRWAISHLASNRCHSPHFEKLRLMWEQVWQQCDAPPDYFTTDYLFALLHERDAAFRAAVEAVPINDGEPHYYDLMPLLHRHFDECEYEALAPASMFICSYKLPKGFDPSTPGTYYRRVVEGTLPPLRKPA